MGAVLMLVRATPCGGIRAREAIDAALLFSAFAPQLAVLFSGDGVWQLVSGQQPDAVGAAAVSSVITAFDDYDIQQVYADGTALAQRGIDPAQLVAGARVLDDAGIRALLAAQDQVLSF